MKSNGIDYVEMNEEETPQAIAMAKYFYQYQDVRNVVDVGCGTGLYLKPYKDLAPACCVHGYDISEEARKNQVIPITVMDITSKDFIGVFPMFADLMYCIETLEHIPADKTDAFIINSLQLACSPPIIAFSGAYPGQGGSGHINCRVKENWEYLWYSYRYMYDRHATLSCLNYVKANAKIWEGWLISNLMILRKF